MVTEGFTLAWTSLVAVTSSGLERSWTTFFSSGVQDRRNSLTSSRDILLCGGGEGAVDVPALGDVVPSGGEADLEVEDLEGDLTAIRLMTVDFRLSTSGLSTTVTLGRTSPRPAAAVEAGAFSGELTGEGDPERVDDLEGLLDDLRLAPGDVASTVTGAGSIPDPGCILPMCPRRSLSRLLPTSYSQPTPGHLNRKTKP